MKLDVLTSKELVLPFVLPAIVEVLLISFILITILGVRQTDIDLNKNAIAISKLDTIFHEVTLSLVRVLTQDDEQLTKSLPEIREILRKDTLEVKNSPEMQDLHAKSTAELTDLMNDLSEVVETLEGALKTQHSPGSGIVMGKAALILQKVRPPSDDIYNRLRTRHRELLQQRETVWSSTIGMLVLAMVTPIMAAVYSFVFAGRLTGRMDALRASVVKISLGDRLDETLSGSDEFSELKRAILDLSVVMDRARRKERAMIDNAAEIICSLDDSLKLQEVNPAVERRLGYDQQQLIGINIHALIHPDDRLQTYNELESIKTKSSEVNFEARLRHREGQYIFTEWSANWSPDDRSILCVIHDISDRKRAEQLKQDVIAMVSHDLRAPLTSIAVVLDMVMEGAAGELNDRGDRLVSRAQLSVQSLISMIKDLLDIERFEAGGLTLTLDNNSALELIQRSVDMVRPEAERKKLLIDISSEEITLVCDAERVNRILVNLINNAIKFCKYGKTICVTGKLVKDKGQPAEIEFQIIDEGPGIPENKVEAIFEKFTQVGTGSEGERSGSGLGLAICKALVEAHKGKIGVKSIVGEGTTFWFRLPQEGTTEQNRSNAS